MKIHPVCNIDVEDIEDITVQELVEIFAEWDWECLVEIINEYCMQQEDNIQEVLDGTQDFPKADLIQTAKEFLQKISGATVSQPVEEEEEKQEEKTYHIGQKFRHEDGDTYVLASVKHREWLLVDVDKGLRYGLPVEFSHGSNNFDFQEFSRICQGDPDKFTLIG